MLRSTVTRFPLGKTGGLIEAMNGPRYPSQVARGFRWVKPAASLKHHAVGGAATTRQARFPLGKTGGLIEASPLLLFARLRGRVSAG